MSTGHSTTPTTMASPPPGKESKLHGWLTAPQRVFKRVRDMLPNSRPPSPVLLEYSTANLNIPAEDLGMVRDHRSQDAVFPTPHPDTNISEKIKKAWDVTQSGLLTALRLLEMSSDAFPPLKSAVAGLVACLDLAQVSYSCGFNILYHV